MDNNTKRNRDIGKLLDTKKLSYAVIAEMMGTTRCAVSGIAFRRRHPPKVCQRSPNSRGGRNKIGHGYQPASYYPKKTIHVPL